MSQLVRYDAMLSAIAECHRVDEVVEIRDKARAMEVYASQAMNVEAERKAIEIRLRAERKCGELLKERDKAKGGRPTEKRSHDATSFREEKTLSDLGISKTQSSRWQKMAEMPAEKFENILAEPAVMPSTAGIIRAMSEPEQVSSQSLRIWGIACAFEREKMSEWDGGELLDGMVITMRDDMRRLLPRLIDFLTELKGTLDERPIETIEQPSRSDQCGVS